MSDRLGDTPSTEVYSAHIALSRYTVRYLCIAHCTHLVCSIFFSTEPSWQPLGVAVASELHCTAVCVQVWDLGFMENSVVCVAQGYCSGGATTPLGLADGQLDHTSPPTPPPSWTGIVISFRNFHSWTLHIHGHCLKSMLLVSQNIKSMIFLS